jgi:HNH endonuclease domain protein
MVLLYKHSINDRRYNMSPLSIFFYIVMLIITVCVIAGIDYLRIYLKSPFEYPYFIRKFDVTGKRNIDIEDYIDTYLIENRFDEIQNYYNMIQQWKVDSEEKVNKTIFKKLRRKQYLETIDDEHAFVFQTIRKRTRYTQSNYTSSPYKVEMVDSQKEFSYKDIYNRYMELENIDFECTLREYHNKTRCAFVPQELYYRVKLRDNYKCQHCERQIRDSQKAYIDHVIPIAKGGKNIPSNLQVLCEMCNKRKHSP